MSVSANVNLHEAVGVEVEDSTIAEAVDPWAVLVQLDEVDQYQPFLSQPSPERVPTGVGFASYCNHAKHDQTPFFIHLLV